MAVDTYKWKIGAKINYDPTTKCWMTMEANPRTVCGTDGYDYKNIQYLRCVQTMEYGKRVNLQLSHRMGCWIWEQHGIETSTLCAVSILRID